ncbi:MAG: TIGR01777 family protein [Desulfobacteraceae bacterium]|nr:TIGR01777 family protein [Desulfobacteraceae bacterium]
MKIVIIGGSGFIGRHLCKGLLKLGHGVTCLGTREFIKETQTGNFVYLQADTTCPGKWRQVVQDADTVVNLAGKSIFQRWSRRYKRQIYGSRVLTTRHVVEALPEQADKVLISASAVGYYGGGGDLELSESSPNGKDFLASVARDWEAEALKASSKGVRTVITRFGIVLGAGGGALPTMLPAFRSYAGGALGSGRQWFSWIHIRDLVNVIVFLIDRSDLKGPFNLCAPNPVRNKDLALALGHALARPAVMTVPAFVLKMVLGEFAEVLLAGQRARPDRLIESGFEFEFAKIEPALADLLKPPHKTPSSRRVM